jgi:multiple sugar transport system permease protein
VLGIAVGLVVLWTVIPFYAAINASFTPEVSFLSRPPRFFPWPVYLGNYQAALFGSGSNGSGGGQAMLVAMRNSLIVSAAVTALNVVIGALAGYAFARSRGNGVVSGTLWLLMLTRMIPGLSLLVPFFLLFQSFGLVDSLQGLIVAYTSFILPLVAWILKSYFETVPASLERAALVDGCTRIGALIRVVVPVGLPGIVAAAIFAFIVSWNLFVYPAVLATSADTQTLPVAIASFISDQRVWNPAIVYAAGMFALIPPVVISIVLQRYVIRGLTAGAVKG